MAETSLQNIESTTQQLPDKTNSISDPSTIATRSTSLKSSTSFGTTEIMTSASISQLTLLIQKYIETFGPVDDLIHSSAPGRIEILGNHTDYNDGYVMSAAIDLRCHCIGTVEKSSFNKLSVYSASFPEAGICEVDMKDIMAPENDTFEKLQKYQQSKSQQIQLPAFMQYIIGVFREFFKKLKKVNKDNESQDIEIDFNNYSFTLYLDSEVPLGAAVSSSAALEVSIALFLKKALSRNLTNNSSSSLKLSLSDLDIILLCKSAENNYVQMGCGILDQWSSSQGEEDSVLFLDCRYPMEKKVKIKNEQLSFVLANTGVKHQLVDGQYDKLKQWCYKGRDEMRKGMLLSNKQQQTSSSESQFDFQLRDLTVSDFENLKHHITDQDSLLRAQHICYENDRVLRAKTILTSIIASTSTSTNSSELDSNTVTTIEPEPTLQSFGHLMYESHLSSQNLFQNSCQELDQMVEFALSSPGYLGSRLMGGGFGGCTINLVQKGKESEFIKDLVGKWKEKYGKNNAPDVRVVKPGKGAEVNRLNIRMKEGSLDSFDVVDDES